MMTMCPTTDAVRRTMIALRSDALDRGMRDLAIAYGWSAIHLGVEMWDAPPKTEPHK